MQSRAPAQEGGSFVTWGIALAQQSPLGAIRIVVIHHSKHRILLGTCCIASSRWALGHGRHVD